MNRYIGLMSGTSLDGIDGVLTAADPDTGRQALLAAAFTPFDAALRAELLALQVSGDNEIQRETQISDSEEMILCLRRVLYLSST